MMIRVSVIVPVYNVQNYLRRCLDSLASQTMQEIEIILVNDGSTDNSKNICQEYVDKYAQFKLVSQKNQGLSGARNTGIKIAKGEYIGFVDSDDYVEKDMFELLYDNAIRHKVDISACGYDGFDECGHIHPCVFKDVRSFYERDEALDYFLVSGYFDVLSWNKLYKRKLFEDIRFPVGKIYEDILTIYKLIDKAGGLYYDSSVEYHYLKRTDSLSQTISRTKINDLTRYVDDFVRYCVESIKKPNMVYLGQIQWYMIALNKLISVHLIDDKLFNIIRKLIKKKIFKLSFSSKINVKDKIKCWLILMNPGLYVKIYWKFSK